MITINSYTTQKNIDDPNYDILSVRYIVSQDPTFIDDEKIIANVIKAKTDSTMMSFSFEHDFEDNLPIYAKIIFNYPNDKSEVSTVCRCVPNQAGFSLNNNIITTPKVTIKEYSNYNQIPTNGFTIEVSEMSMFEGNGEHVSTGYKIIDTNGVVKFKSDRDEFNLTSIYIPEDTLEDNKSYTIEVVQYNNYDSESYPAILIISTEGDYNLFHIVDSSVKLYENSVSTFSFVQNLPGFKHITIDILDSALNTVLSNFISKVEVVKIPKIGMNVGETYYIIARATYTNFFGEEVTTDDTTLNSVCLLSDNDNIYYPDYIYNNVFEIAEYDFEDDFIGNTNLLKGITKQFDNGDIPLYKITNSNTIEIRFYKYSNLRFSYTGRNVLLTTASTIIPEEGVNIYLLEDDITGNHKLFIACIVDIDGVEVTELHSYYYTTGENANVDLTIPSEILHLPFRTLLSNGTPVIDYKANSFILASVPLDENNKQTTHAVKKDLSGYTPLIELYNPNAVIGNSISTFPLPDNKMLLINTDQSPITYGVYDRTDDIYDYKGNIITDLQNVSGDINLNKFYGYTRLDGKVLLIPNITEIDKFSIYLYNPDNNSFVELIPYRDVDFPGKYSDANNSVKFSRIFTIELNSGNCLFLLSGDSEVFGRFTDVWEYK